MDGSRTALSIDQQKDVVLWDLNRIVATVVSAEATGWVWRNSPYRGSERLVHLAIADVVNDAHNNEFWMSSYGLAEKAGVSRSTVVRVLKDMSKRGLMELVESGQATRRPSRYRLTSAMANLASSTIGLASANMSPPLGSPPRANSIELKKLKEELTSTTTSLVADPECFDCHGSGIAYYAGAGAEGPCMCTKPIAKGW